MLAWNKKTDKWISNILFNGKKVHLGSFTDGKEASEYYENAVISITNGTEITIKPRQYIKNSRNKGKIT